MVSLHELDTETF
jgi:hypothetical protein